MQRYRKGEKVQRMGKVPAYAMTRVCWLTPRQTRAVVCASWKPEMHSICFSEVTMPWMAVLVV